MYLGGNITVSVCWKFRTNANRFHWLANDRYCFCIFWFQNISWQCSRKILKKRDGFQWLRGIWNNKNRDKVQISISAFYESYDIKRKVRATHIYKDLRAKITNEVNAGHLQQITAHRKRLYLNYFIQLLTCLIFPASAAPETFPSILPSSRSTITCIDLVPEIPKGLLSTAAFW